MAETSSEDGETSDPIDVSLAEGDSNTSMDASTGTRGDSDSSWAPCPTRRLSAGPLESGSRGDAEPKEVEQGASGSPAAKGYGPQGPMCHMVTQY